jgi:hypothetical protein
LISAEYLEPNDDFVPTTLYLNENISEFEKIDTRNELKGAIRFLASLSSIDGCVLLTTDLIVKGFGVVIKVTESPEWIYISKTAKINLNKLTKVHPDSFGTRHRSMFAYCWKNTSAIGFVVSQDGDVRAISKIGDKLIMWENINIQHFIKSDKLNSSKLKHKETNVNT